MISPFIIGITGGSGSGKTSFAKALAESFVGRATLMSLDNYYYPKHLQPTDHQGLPNFDLPQSLNLSQFQSDLMALAQGKSIVQQEYTFNNPAALSRPIVLEPQQLLIVEGLYVMYLEESKKLYHLSIYVDATEETKLERRLKRDLIERGYDREDVLYSHQYHVAPSFQQHIEIHRGTVDLVIPNNTSFDKGLGVVRQFLNSALI
jgi:uridine kinase